MSVGKEHDVLYPLKIRMSELIPFMLNIMYLKN